jgi:hypothetical protein
MPERPQLASIEPAELMCLSDQTYINLMMRQLALKHYIEQLELTIEHYNETLEKKYDSLP